MKRNFKFDKKQSELIRQSIDAFKNDAVRSIAENYITGGVGTSYSQGTYAQFYSRVSSTNQLPSLPDRPTRL